MMPTDEKFIELLRKIKEHCINIEKCQKCTFWTGERCQISMLAESLDTVPCDWEMEETERIIHL